MASEEEIQPQCERIYRIDGMFPTIDNLVHFPTEILMPIFAEVDDIGLLRIISINQRFEAIARLVFERRYSDKYFVIKGEANSDRGLYWELFRVFGSSIKAVRLNGLHGINQHHWLAQVLQKHTKNVEKISFRSCYFIDVTGFLFQHLHITDLQIRDSRGFGNEFDLPEYRHLKKLELGNFDCLSIQSFERSIRNNPRLESLVLRSGNDSTLIDVMRLVCTYQMDLKELKVLHDPSYSNNEHTNWTQFNSLVDRFTDTVKCIQSLAISIRVETIELLRQLGRKCKRLKRLELDFEFDQVGNEAGRVLQSIDTTEHLTLRQFSYGEAVGLFIGSLPSLRSLIIEFTDLPTTHNYILSLLRMCPGLEMVIIRSPTREAFECPNIQFHCEFVKLADHPGVKVRFIDSGQTIGTVTKSDIIWREKLVHWIGYEPSHSKSDLNLLGLVNTRKPSNHEKEDPFGVILSYLDLGSLYALSRASKSCEQLVDSYVRRHSLLRRAFVITDEFKIDYNGLCAFGPYVNNLIVIRLNYSVGQLRLVVREQCANLEKLCYQSHVQYHWPFIFPSVRHMVYNNRYPSSFHLLCETLQTNPKLETLDLGKVDRYFGTAGCVRMHLFRDLKKFTFKPSNQKQVEFVEDLFKDMPTEVIIEN